MMLEIKRHHLTNLLPVMMACVLLVSLVMAATETVGWNFTQLSQLTDHQLDDFLRLFIWDFFMWNIWLGAVMFAALVMRPLFAEKDAQSSN